MKKIFFILFAMFLWSGVQSQTVLYEDNFDSYAVDSWMAVNNPTWWNTWGNTPGGLDDAKVKDTYSRSPTKSVNPNSFGSNHSDLILKLGDKTSGSYELTWWMYVETNKKGYYNIQHFQSPGIEWAFDVYFNRGGTAALLLNGDSNIKFNYPKATWYEVKHIFNLDKDSAILYVNGIKIHQWPFHWTGSGSTGTNQLGGVDFYSENTETCYYFDDLVYTELASPSNPVINVTPDLVWQGITAGQTGKDTLVVSNTGTGDLEYTIYTLYTIDKDKSAPQIATAATTENKVKVSLSNCSSAPTPGATHPNTDATAVLNYDEDNTSSVGWNNPPITVTVAARFTNVETLPYEGMNIESVDVFVAQLNTSGSNLMTLKIYDMGNFYEPGTLLHSQTFTPVGGDWEHLVLTAPVNISGKDVWVGYQFTQTDAGVYIPGKDDTDPPNPNANLLSSGVGWTHLTLTGHWNIRANLIGDLPVQWLSVTPKTGVITPGSTEEIFLTFTTTYLTEGEYSATLKFYSNDPVTSELDVPVTLDVYAVGIDELQKFGVMVYPNPVTDILNVVSNDQIKQINLIDFNGKIVYSGTLSKIDVSKLSAGAYYVQTTTVNGNSTIKFIKK